MEKSKFASNVAQEIFAHYSHYKSGRLTQQELLQRLRAFEVGAVKALSLFQVLEARYEEGLG